MINILHKLLFLILLIPIGFLLIFEIVINLFIQFIKWIIFGNFNDDFILNLYTMKIIDIFNFDKFL
jgi:hypothetical protein